MKANYSGIPFETPHDFGGQDMSCCLRCQLVLTGLEVIQNGPKSDRILALIRDREDVMLAQGREVCGREAKSEAPCNPAVGGGATEAGVEPALGLSAELGVQNIYRAPDYRDIYKALDSLACECGATKCGDNQHSDWCRAK